MTGYLDVLLIEDDQVLGGALRQRLLLEQLSVQWVESCAQAVEVLRRTRLRPAFLLADIRLPDGSGEDLYRQLIPYLANTTVVFATAYGDIAQAVRLVAAGANDYLTKPYDTDALVARIRAAVNAFDGGGQAGAAKREPPFGFDAATADIAQAIERLAVSGMPILLEGETGVGKDMTAKYMHLRSPHAGGPFVAVNCAALSDALVEDQLFGHARGAFSGANGPRDGYIAQAGTGTLFLDEISELAPRAQAMLLRVLEDGVYQALGAAQPVRMACRIVASSNVNLDNLLGTGNLRADLFYRLAVGRLRLPPLRQRPDGILILARRFLAERDMLSSRPPRGLSPQAEAALVGHDWPGNVRELRNRVHRAAAMTDAVSLDVTDLFPEKNLDAALPPDLAALRADAEWQGIQRAIAEAGGKLGEAARILGVSRTTLWKKMRQARDRNDP